MGTGRLVDGNSACRNVSFGFVSILYFLTWFSSYVTKRRPKEAVKIVVSITLHHKRKIHTLHSHSFLSTHSVFVAGHPDVR